MADDFQGVEVFKRPRRASNPARKAAGPQKAQSGEPRAHSRAIGVASFAFSVLTVVLVCVGIGEAMGGSFAASTMTAYLAVGASVVAVVGGLVALGLGRGRTWGLAAVIVGLLANPVLLTRLLGAASGLG